MKPLRNIGIVPSLLTLGNGFCGCLALAKIGDAMLYTHHGVVSPDPAHMAIFEAKILSAAWLIFLGMVFDALDGSVARFQGSTSGFGAQLDSLCDVVTFGVAPAFLVKVLIEHHVLVVLGTQPHPRLYLLVSVFFALCAILRLARFNAEHERLEEAHTYFRGLPTPAAAGILAGAVVVMYGFPHSSLVDLVPALATVDLRSPITIGLAIAAPLLGLLMISRIRYVHGASLLKGRRTFPFLVLCVLVVAIVLLEPELTLGLIFLGYIISGPAGAVLRRMRGEPDDGEQDGDDGDVESDGEAPGRVVGQL